MSDPDPDAALTLAEAARLTGRSAEALRARWRRGTLRGFKGNDGKLRVYVDPADRGTAKVVDQSDSAERPASRPIERPAERPDAGDAELVALREHVSDLRAEVAWLRGRLETELERRHWPGLWPALVRFWRGGA